MVTPVTFWQKAVDGKTNHIYYWNQETLESSWTLPDGGVIVSGESNETADDGEMIDELLENYPSLKKPPVSMDTGEV